MTNEKLTKLKWHMMIINKTKGKVIVSFKKDKYKEAINENTDLIKFNLVNNYFISIMFNTFNHLDLLKWNPK